MVQCSMNKMKTGDKVRVVGNAKGTTWEFAWITDIKNNKAYIQFGSKSSYLALQPQWIEMNKLEPIDEDQEVIELLAELQGQKTLNSF